MGHQFQRFINALYCSFKDYYQSIFFLIYGATFSFFHYCYHYSVMSKTIYNLEGVQENKVIFTVYLTEIMYYAINNKWLSITFRLHYRTKCNSALLSEMKWWQMLVFTQSSDAGNFYYFLITNSGRWIRGIEEDKTIVMNGQHSRFVQEPNRAEYKDDTLLR